MDNLKYQDYVDLGIYPALDENGTMHFSKPNIDFIIVKYLKLKNQFEELKKHKLDIKNKRIIDKILTGKILHLDGDSCLDNKTFPLT